MSRLPISLFFLLALAVLVGLQAIPIVGVVLMLFGSIFIAGFAVHAFLIGLAVEALTGRVSRGLIAIPLLAYGGYYVMYAAQRSEIAHKSAQMRAANPGKIFDFNPDLHSLVIKEPVPFINAHEVPVAYEANPNFQPEGHLAYRLIPRAQCDIKRDTQARDLHLRRPPRWRVPAPGLPTWHAGSARPRGGRGDQARRSGHLETHSAKSWSRPLISCSTARWSAPTAPLRCGGCRRFRFW